MALNRILGYRLLSTIELSGAALSTRSFSKTSLVKTTEKNLFKNFINPKPINKSQYFPNVKLFRPLSSVEVKSADSLPQGGSDGIGAAQPAETLGKKVSKVFNWLSGSQNTAMYVSALKIYASCAQGINYSAFFEACGMPDTFQSWFIVNQLHVWMCLVRLKAEGREGQFVYRKLVEIMWQDVQGRMDQMGEIDSKTVKESLRELVQQFYAMIFAYDEGLLSHDRVLAAALWRNMFHDKRNTDASELANLVKYVRRQVQHLDQIDSEHLMSTGHIPWLPFNTTTEQNKKDLLKEAKKAA